MQPTDQNPPETLDGGLAGIVSDSPGPVLASAPGGLVTRKNVSAMTDGEKRSFRDAYARLASSGALDRIVQAHAKNMSYKMHGTMVTPEGRVRNMPGEEGRLRFLAWHRAYVLEFERELLREWPGGFVPYWDWTLNWGSTNGVSDNGRPIPRWIAEIPVRGVKTVGVPGVHPRHPGFWHQDGSLYEIQIVRFPGEFRFSPTGTPVSIRIRPPTPRQMRRLLRTRSFRRFSSRLEGRSHIDATQPIVGMMHAFGHLFTGGVREIEGKPYFGTMGYNHETPADPLFWLHHAQVDRIWQRWIETTKRRGSSQWRILRLTADGRRMRPWQNRATGGHWTVEELVDSYGSAYRYDSFDDLRSVLNDDDALQDVPELIEDDPGLSENDPFTDDDPDDNWFGDPLPGERVVSL